jgi:hypothetical protein
MSVSVADAYMVGTVNDPATEVNGPPPTKYPDQFVLVPVAPVTGCEGGGVDGGGGGAAAATTIVIVAVAVCGAAAESVT